MRTHLLFLLLFLTTIARGQNDSTAVKSMLMTQLENSYSEQQWFVPMSTALYGLTAEQATWNDGTSNHSIAQLVSHVIFWNRRVLQAFNGEEVTEFKEENSVTFDQFNNQDWQSVLQTLDSVQSAWKKAVANANEAKLKEWSEEILNMCGHNAYHTGQMVYIRKHKGWWGDAAAKAVPLEKVALGRFKRLHKLNDSVYRSEQPNNKEFRALEAMGIKTAISFRRKKDDTRKAKGTNLDLIHMPLKTSELTEDQLLEALQAITKAEKPVLAHCWHGSDRTGATMAAYRVVVEQWTKEAAIAELRLPELGYHENWYPNVVGLIQNLDVPRLRKALGL